MSYAMLCMKCMSRNLSNICYFITISRGNGYCKNMGGRGGGKLLNEEIAIVIIVSTLCSSVYFGEPLYQQGLAVWGRIIIGLLLAGEEYPGHRLLSYPRNRLAHPPRN